MPDFLPAEIASKGNTQGSSQRVQEARTSWGSVARGWRSMLLVCCCCVYGEGSLCHHQLLRVKKNLVFVTTIPHSQGYHHYQSNPLAVHYTTSHYITTKMQATVKSNMQFVYVCLSASVYLSVRPSVCPSELASSRWIMTARLAWRGEGRWASPRNYTDLVVLLWRCWLLASIAWLCFALKGTSHSCEGQVSLDMADVKPTLERSDGVPRQVWSGGGRRRRRWWWWWSCWPLLGF